MHGEVRVDDAGLEKSPHGGVRDLCMSAFRSLSVESVKKKRHRRRRNASEKVVPMFVARARA